MSGISLQKHINEVRIGLQGQLKEEVLAAKPDDPSLTPRFHMVRRNMTFARCPVMSTHVLQHVCVHAHTKINKTFKNVKSRKDKGTTCSDHLVAALEQRFKQKSTAQQPKGAMESQQSTFVFKILSVHSSAKENRYTKSDTREKEMQKENKCVRVLQQSRYLL